MACSSFRNLLVPRRVRLLLFNNNWDGTPIRVINEILTISNIPIEISVIEDSQIVARKDGGAPYSIAELSDGERNAMLLAADVLTVDRGTLLLIDEPERHLHRSIISPLLTRLIAKRDDCAFIISSHEVMLSLDIPGARTLLVRGCALGGAPIDSWEVDEVPTSAKIDEDLKRDILGARRTVLFVEGTEMSLDRPLYSLLFPNVSVVSKSSCRDVERAVRGIRDAGELHWLRAFGVVDNDQRPREEIERLRERGVHALSVFSVESIYYDVDIQRRIAERHADIVGEDASARVENAKAAALASIKPYVRQMSERVAEKAVRQKFLRHMPRRSDIAAGTTIDVHIDVETIGPVPVVVEK